MPKVSKIRISNILLDDKNKIIGDKIFRLYGENSLFLLENGGGKSSVIQYIHQLILPNHEMGKRKMTEMVPVGNTIHVAAEWIQDDEFRSNFITGFCYQNTGKKSKDSNDTYRYFNYIIEYDYEGAYRIEDLPFIVDRKPATYDVIREKLKRSKGVTFSSTNAKYQDDLEQFGILSSEWGNISMVNSSEGGVTDFFEKADTTQRLLEKLLIPSIIESLYPNEEERDSIKESFKKYKDSLMELPEMRKNLRDYNIINQSSDEIIDICKEYNGLKEQLIESQTLLSRLYVTLLDNSKVNKKELEQIVTELVTIDNLKKELNWKIQSYTVLQMEKKLKLAEQIANGDLEKVQETQKVIGKLKRNEKEQFASRAFGDYTKNKTKWNKINAERSTFEMEKGERQEEFHRLRNDISKKFYYLFHQNKQSQLEAKEQYARNANEMKNTQKQIKGVEKEKAEIEKQKAIYKNNVEMYESELLELKIEFLTDWKTDETDTFSHLTSKLEETQEKENEYKNQAGNLDSTLRELERSIERNRMEREKKEKEGEVAENKFEIFSDVEIKLIKETYQLLTIQIKDNLFNEKDEILLKSERVEQKYENEIIKKSIEMDNVEKIQRIIENKGYHIHTELEAVKEYLVQNGVDVVLGVEWITKVQMDEQAKKELLKKNPLLPVSILVENVQITKVKRILNSFKDELSIPIILIDKSTIEKQQEKEEIYQVEDSSYIFHHFKVRLTMEDWESYLDELGERLKGMEDEREELKSKLNEVQEYQRNIGLFWKQYNPNSRMELKTHLNEIEKQIRTLDEVKTKLMSEIQERQAKHEKVIRNWKEKEQERIEVSDKTKKLSNFMKRYSDINNIREQLKKVIDQIKKLEEEINKLEGLFETLEKSSNEENERYHHFKTKIELLKKDSDDYEIQKNQEVTETTEEEFRETFEKYKVLREDYSSDARRLGDLESALSNYKELIERATSDMKRNGFSVEAMEKLGLEFNEGILEEIQLELNDLENRLAIENETKDQSREAFIRIQEKYDSVIRIVEETYDWEIYQYGISPDSELQLYKSQLAIAESDENKKIDKNKVLSDQQSENIKAIEHLENLKEMLIHSPLLEVLEVGEWNKKKPIEDVWRLRKEIDDKKKKINEKDNELKKRHEQLKEDVRKTNNTSLIQLTFEISKILDSSKGNYEEIITTFVRLIDAVKSYEESINLKKRELDRQSGELVEQMFERSETIYKNIMEIAKSSQVEDKGEIISLFRITWPKKDVDESKHSFDLFINDILEELVKMNSENAKLEEIDAVFQKRFNMIDIINCYAETSVCTIKTLKHRNELITKNDFYEWDKVSKWSGGEKHATQISMFISLINHLRKKRFAKEDAWKFIILDNPFGKASSDFVVKPMVSLAKKTNTQLFCFTGIKERAIQREFETVFSNQYVSQRGRMFLSTEEKHKDPGAAELDSIFFVRQS
jgi:hypothetical protein